MPNVTRAQLPGTIMSIPVTISLLVDARGMDEQARIEDAKDQARKWGGKAVRDVGDPREFKGA